MLCPIQLLASFLRERFWDHSCSHSTSTTSQTVFFLGCIAPFTYLFIYLFTQMIRIYVRSVARTFCNIALTLFLLGHSRSSGCWMSRIKKQTTVKCTRRAHRRGITFHSYTYAISTCKSRQMCVTQAYSTAYGSLSHERYIDDAVAKAYKKSNFTLRASWASDTSTLFRLFPAYVRPLLERRWLRLKKLEGCEEDLGARKKKKSGCSMSVIEKDWLLLVVHPYC